MKEFTVVIDYDNDGRVCQYFYCEHANNIKQAINEAIEEFMNFMKMNGKTVEIIEIDAWIRSEEGNDYEGHMV